MRLLSADQSSRARRAFHHTDNPVVGHLLPPPMLGGPAQIAVISLHLTSPLWPLGLHPLRIGLVAKHRSYHHPVRRLLGVSLACIRR